MTEVWVTKFITALVFISKIITETKVMVRTLIVEAETIDLLPHVCYVHNV